MVIGRLATLTGVRPYPFGRRDGGDELRRGVLIQPFRDRIGPAGSGTATVHSLALAKRAADVDIVKVRRR